MALSDRLSRPLTDLRISVTDRCNMRCRYCMPREVFGRDYAFMSHDELLTFEELALLARVLVGEGVRKLRLTGGEPLLRRDLDRLVAMLAAIPGAEDLALTTNGTMLAAKAQALASAGLRRVTVSLDALDDRTFQAVGDTRLPVRRVLDGIDAALDAGLAPVKVNMVVRRSLNEDAVLAMAGHFRAMSQRLAGNGPVLRFIEYMDVGTTNGWRPEQVVPSAELRARIERHWPLEPMAPERPGEVASRYRYLDGGGEIGFVSSVTQPFCGKCSRARLSADGRLHTCLFASMGHDLRGPLREGASEKELAALVGEIWKARADRYSAERESFGDSPQGGSAARVESSARRQSKPRVEMSFIGG